MYDVLLIVASLVSIGFSSTTVATAPVVRERVILDDINHLICAYLSFESNFSAFIGLVLPILYLVIDNLRGKVAYIFYTKQTLFAKSESPKWEKITVYTSKTLESKKKPLLIRVWAFCAWKKTDPSRSLLQGLGEELHKKKP
jgi:hypothetical protein